MRTYDPKSSHIHPTFNNLVIRRDASVEQLTPSGLVIPGSSTDKPCRGTVVAAGPGYRTPSGETVPCSVAAGDVVVWSRLVEGAIVTVDGEDLLVISEDVVVATITDQVLS